MGSKGKMSLSFNSGKRSKDLQRSSFSDGSEVGWASFSGKRMKDGLAAGEERSPGLSDLHPDAFAWGLMGQSDPFLGFDAAGFFSQHSELEDRMKGQRTRTPRKSARGRATARKTRGLRASPKPVSSLQSCLQAQIQVDERDRERSRRVSRPLNFSALPDTRVEYGDVNQTDDTTANFSPLDTQQSNEGLVKRYKGTLTGTESGETFNLAGLIPLPWQQKDSSGDLNATHVSESKDGKTNASKRTEPSIVADGGHCVPLAVQEWWNKVLLPLMVKEGKISGVHQVLSRASGEGAKCGHHAEDLAMSPLEGLLFSFGVDVGVMSVTNKNRVEVERLSQLLKEAQCQVEDLKKELGRRGGCMPGENERAQKVQAPVLAVDDVTDRPPVGEEAGRTQPTTLAVTGQVDGRNSAHGGDAHDEMLSEDHESIRSVATMTSSFLQGDQMAELEAELEAELDQLTGGDSVVLQQQISVFDETEEEIDDDDYSAPAERVHMNNYAVSPRELTRLLLKLQATRQEELITELEEELETAQTQLKDKEEELEMWKDCVRRLTEVSLVPAFSGDETLAARTPTGATPITRSDRDVEVTAAVRSSLVSEDQESYNFSLPNSGKSSSFSLSELSGKRATNLPGGMENKPHKDTADQDHGESLREAASHSENQWASDDVCDEFLRVMSDGGVVEVVPQKEKAVPSSSSMDCKLIIEDCEIEKLLIDSVQDLKEPIAAESSVVGSNTPSVYDYSSRVSMEDGWDNLPNTDVGGVAAWHVKLLAPHPSRRSSFNGHESKSKQSKEEEEEEEEEEKEGSQWHSEKLDWSSTAFVECSRAVDSSKIPDEIPDGGLVMDYKSSDTPCSVKYIDMSAKPAHDDVVNSAEYGDSDGLCCAVGSKSPSHEAREQFLKTPRRLVEAEQQQQQQQQQHSLYVTKRNTVELSPTVLDKIAHWEGLMMEGETPGPIMGSDWECQSRASELEQQQCTTLDSSYEDGDVFGEDNLVLEAEEMFGQMLITQIVEKTRRGSHIVKNAQTMLATFEKDEIGNVAVDTCSSQMPWTDGRMGEPGGVPHQLAKPTQPHDDNPARPETGVTTAAERETVQAEYDLLGRLTLRTKDKRVPEGLKDRTGKEPSYMMRLDMEQIPVLDLGENSQFVQGSESYGVRDVVLHDILCGSQSTVGSSRDTRLRGTADVNKSEIRLSNRDVHREVYGGSGLHREDEVRTRRRL